MPSHQQTKHYLTQYFTPTLPSCSDLSTSMDGYKNGMRGLTEMLALKASPARMGRNYTSCKFLGDATAVDQGTTLQESPQAEEPINATRIH